MQSNWQKNLYHQEITPPQGAWESIALGLDAATPIENIYNLEEMPPQDAWAGITNALDKVSGSSWEENIYQQETVPPAEIWASISEQLDNNTTTENNTKVIALRSGKWYRVAAAAAIVIGISAGSIWLFNRNPNSPAETVLASSQPVHGFNPTPVPKQISGSINGSKTASANAIVTTTVHNFSQPKAEPQITAVIKPLVYTTDAPTPVEEDKTEVALYNRKKLENPDVNPVTEMDNTVTVANGSYISISGPDGQTVRLSSKFSNLVGYLNDTAPEQEELLDKIIRESAFWKTRFRKWREKMLNNVSAPAFTNFFDVAELGKLLEEADEKQ